MDKIKQSRDPETNRLVDEVIQLMGTEMQRLKSEHLQLLSIVQSATSNLSDSLERDIATVMDAKQTLLASVEALGAAHEIRTISSEMEQHLRDLLNNFLISLQFEDMYTQLSTHMNHRFETLEQISEFLSLSMQQALSSKMPLSEGDMEDKLTQLKKLLDANQQSSVAKSDLNTGEVELF